MMLKSNKGLTLTSLVIYIIVLMIVIALMSNFSGHFYKNTNEISLKENNDEQITRFLAYLTKDTNSEELIFIKTGTETNESNESAINYIILKFRNGEEHQYLYKENNSAIYYINNTTDESKKKNIILCRNISTCGFEYNGNNKILTINFIINNKLYSKSLDVRY